MTTMEGTTLPTPDPKRDPRPCGSDITYYANATPRDMDDHPIAIVHEAWANELTKQLGAVLVLHQCDPDGFVPMCIECGKVYPCPTAVACDA